MKPQRSTGEISTSIPSGQNLGKGSVFIPLLLMVLWLAGCKPADSDQVPVTELPDPAIYALTIAELPDVRLSWHQTYNQTLTDPGYKWAYLAYQAYQSGSLGGALESGFAVNNDVYLYEVNISHQDLPQPPQAIGSLQNISWKTVSQTHRIGDKSALWKTEIGEMLTPAWRLEFYQQHAYVCISLFGFPDQIAQSIIYDLGDQLASRLPRSVSVLRSDAATRVATEPESISTVIPEANSTPNVVPDTTPTPLSTGQDYLIPVMYTAPTGETGMVSYFDETGNQLSDGIFGNDDILADTGLGIAYEWVGWIEATDPITLTFNFAGQSDISAVEIGFYHRDGMGIFIPSRVSINAQSFELSKDEVANNTRGDLTFAGAFSGPAVQIALQHRGRGWILVDEIRFIPGKR